MKGTEVVLGQIGERRAAARLVDGRLEDLIVDPVDDGVAVPGTIFRAKADRPVKGMGGQFLRLPDGQKAFLRQGQIAPGKSALVQVTGYTEPGKAVPVSAKLILKGRYVIVTPGAPGINVSRQIRDDARRDALILLATETAPDARGVILRSSSEHADDNAIATELAALHDLSGQIKNDADGSEAERLLDGPDAHEIAWLEWDGAEHAITGFDDHGVTDLIEAMQTSRADLPGGATAWIEPTRALVAVDVNTGGDTSPAAGLKANIALARDLPRQLRCRGLGGQVVIDFAPFPKKDRRQVEQVLRSAFRADSIETALVGWTPLGHFELQRKRERLPLV